MDKLKQYLQEHREEMDADLPAAFVFPAIKPVKKGIPPVIKIMSALTAAAAIITAVFFGIRFNQQPVQGVASAVESFSNAGYILISPDTPILLIKDEQPASKTITAHREKKPMNERYALMKAFSDNYNQLVNYQVNSIRSTPVYAENAAYFSDFKTRLKQMDMDEAIVRKNIKSHGISDQWLDQLINIYQQKLEVLKSLQAEINKMNNKVEQAADTNSLSGFYLTI